MRVIYGGWYQRTTIHMSEIYDLFAFGRSRLPLSKEKLIEYKTSLGFNSVTREAGYLEYVKAVTPAGVVVKYYEDGLYTLEIESSKIEEARLTLEDFYENKLHPAINFIFSLGAPTPKILANIKTKHPVVVASKVKKVSDFEFDTKRFGDIYSEIPSGDFHVIKTPTFIFVLSKDEDVDAVSGLIDMQIFFREFKDQLEKYLNIHRTIWEEIAELKERKQIIGHQIKEARSKLDQYQKTVSLITNRINQMGSYINTRQAIAKDLKIEESLVKLYQYKFDSLSDSLSYIKEIWKMTSDYLASSIQVLVEIENTSLNNSVKSLQIITSVGVIAGILNYLTRESLPQPTYFGVIFFLILIGLTIALNLVIAFIYRSIRYKIKIYERKEDI